MIGIKNKPNTSYIVQYEKDDTFDSEKFLKLRMRVCHDGTSPNNTHFTLDVLEAAQDTIEYIPILAHTIFDEDGKPMFGAHDSHIEEDRLNEGQQKLIYDEIPIGLVPSNMENNRSIEEYDGKNYQFVDAYIWREYSNYCEQLLEDAVDSKLSMEISIPEDKLAYNAKEKYWDISEYKYRGITILNENCGTGMKSALATTENFELNENSLKDKMLILMEQLQDCLRDYNNTSLKEGGNESVNKFEELLTKYSKTVEDVTFEYENLSDEELEAKFAEVFGEEDTDGEGNADPEPTSDGGEGEDSNFENNEDNSEPDNNEPSTEPEAQTEADYSKFNLFQKLFEISFDEIRYALNALCSVYRTDDEWCYVSQVYEEYFIMEDWDNNKYYKQSYEKDGDNVSLSGERIEMFNIMVTESEKLALDEMRSNYSALEIQLNEYKLAEENAKKDALFVSEDYSSIANKDEFKSLAENHVDFSVDELKTKLDSIILDYAKKNALEFSVKAPEKKRINRVSFGVNMETSKPEDEFKPYGDLFDK